MRVARLNTFLISTTVLALGTWVVVLGFVIVQLQHHRPPAILEALGMRSTPVLTMLLVFPLIACRSVATPTCTR
jgi:hypothetical protein